MSLRDLDVDDVVVLIFATGIGALLLGFAIATVIAAIRGACS